MFIQKSLDTTQCTKKCLIRSFLIHGGQLALKSVHFRGFNCMLYVYTTRKMRECAFAPLLVIPFVVWGEEISKLIPFPGISSMALITSFHNCSSAQQWLQERLNNIFFWLLRDNHVSQSFDIWKHRWDKSISTVIGQFREIKWNSI